MIENKRVLVFGATGNIGGAATRELLKRDWHVRAVTRNLESDRAKELSRLGAEIFQADMDDRDSLEAAFEGYSRVFSVQNWTTAGIEGEMRQGKKVADTAKSAGVEHLVYGSAGVRESGTGIPHFENKLVVEDYMRELNLPFTIVRPTPFMELLSQKDFFPAMAAWGIEPKIVGWDTPVPWVAVHDIGIAVANAFEDPETWIGRDVTLMGDIKTLGESRNIFMAVDGKTPFRVPLPLWLFKKMAGDEFIQMWYWLVDYVKKTGRKGLLELGIHSKQLCPEPLDMESWLRMVRNGAAL